jgi:hypothetical protein
MVDRMVHRAAADAGGIIAIGVPDPRRMIAVFTKWRIGEDDPACSTSMAALTCDGGPDALTVRLTPPASARNYLKPFYFIGRRWAEAARCGGCRAGMADILLHDQEDKKQEFRAARRR